MNSPLLKATDVAARLSTDRKVVWALVDDKKLVATKLTKHRRS